MKLFTLIKGDTIHTKEEQKVIPAAAFSTVLESLEVLSTAKSDAEAYRQKVAQECEELKKQAHAEGFDAGHAKWNEQLAHLEKTISQSQEEIKQLVVPLILKATKRLVGKELEVHPDLVTDIVATVLKTVAQHKKIVIYVNREDLPLLEAQRPRLRQIFDGLESLSIVEKEGIERGGCIIETEGGIINAQLEKQWEAMEAAFNSFLKK